LSRISEKLRTTFSRLVLEWGMSPRYLATLSLNFKIVSRGKERRASRPIPGQTYDMSASGLGLLSNQIAVDNLHAYFGNDMITSTQLEIYLEMPEKTVTIIGETCRYQKMETNKLQNYTYLLGVKIVKMSDEDKELYQKFITSIRRNPEVRSPRY
jgi:hypothetical protein